MTKQEFRESMRRGLGRCVIELSGEENIRKYRDIMDDLKLIP